MQQQRTLQKHFFRPAGLALRAALLAVVASTALLAVPGALAQGRAPRATLDQLDRLDQSPTSAVQLASPAVVRIVSVIQASIVCHACLSNGNDIDSPAAGQQPFEFYSAGSGAFITPDGYILTADHVVDHTVNNTEDVNFVLQLASQDIAQQIGSDATTVLNFLNNNLSSITMNLQVVEQKVFLSTAYTGDLQSTADVVSYAVTRIVVNSAVNQDDTAIIKVEANDMPFLPIAPPNSISVGDQVTAIAFPADADDVLQGSNASALIAPTQSDANTLTSLLDASVNTGQVTAKKTLANGTPVYEAGSISSQGSSGGPVIDDQGRIIGFVDAGPSSGSDRLSFLVPSEVIAQYVKQSGNTNPTPGPFERLWAQANQAQFSTAQCHWNTAASDYQQLQQQYPHFGAVASLLANARAHAGPNACPPPAPLGLIFGGLLLVVVAVGGYLYYQRRRKPAVVTALPAGAYGSYGSTPGYAPQLQPSSSPFSPPPVTPPPSTSTPPPPGVGGIGEVPTAPGMLGQGQPPMATPAPTPPQPVTPGVPSDVTPQPPAPITPQPPVVPVPPVPVPPVAVPASATLVCPNGHPIADAQARFCPTCGAPVSAPQEPPSANS